MVLSGIKIKDCKAIGTLEVNVTGVVIRATLSCVKMIREGVVLSDGEINVTGVVIRAPPSCVKMIGERVVLDVAQTWI